MDDQIYEINVKRFIQSTEYQLKKLSDIVRKINEFQTYEDWRNVKQAQQNASQIVKRIRSDIKEISKIRSQIILQLHDKSSSLIVNQIDEKLKEISREVGVQANTINSINAPYYTYELKDSNLMLETNYVSPDPFSYQIKKNETLSKEKDLCDAYHQLQKDCEDLQVIMNTFSKEIFAQKPTIDSIERNVSETEVQIESGSLNLRRALDYKILSTSAGGAIIGSLVGGPVGFVAGAKIGAVCSVGTGLIGYFVARKLRTPEL